MKKYLWIFILCFCFFFTSCHKKNKTTYQIEYNLNGGKYSYDSSVDVVETGNVLFSFEDSTSIELIKPYRSGYKFIGWFENDQLVNHIENKNYNLIAKWEAIYYISYEIDDSFIDDSFVFEYTSQDSFLLPVIEKEGYVFLGWYENEEFEGDKVEKIEVNSSTDYTLYPRLIKGYNIEYNLDGGIFENNPNLYYELEKEDELARPKKQGFTFLGWVDSEYSKNPFFNVPISYAKDLELTAKWEKVIYTISYELDKDHYLDKAHLFRSYFTDFYNYIVDYKQAGLKLSERGIDSLEQFLSAASTWDGGSAGMARIGNIAGEFYLKIDVGGNLENQHSDDGFIGYCLDNGMYLEFIDFIVDFFYWWRLDEGYTGGSSDPNNTGSDFLASAWASLVDTAKFFYFEKNTLPSYFIKKGHVPEFYDRIPYILSFNGYTITYEYDFEEGLTLPVLELPGYEFLGWYDNANFEGDAIVELEKNIFHDIVLYAKIVKTH